jgi:hypothetical protein
MFNSITELKEEVKTVVVFTYVLKTNIFVKLFCLVQQNVSRVNTAGLYNRYIKVFAFYCRSFANNTLHEAPAGVQVWHGIIKLFFVMEWNCVCGTGPLIGRLCNIQMIYEWIQSSGGMTLTGKSRRTRRAPCASAILAITRPTWRAPSANPGLSSQKPATNFLSCGMANSASYNKPTSCCYL